MQSPTNAPLRALAMATALLAGTGVAAAAMVSPADDIEAQTVRFETASDATDETPSTRAPAPAPAPALGLGLGTTGGAGEAASPAPVDEVTTAPGSAPQSGVEGYAIDKVEEFTGRIPLPLSASTLGRDLPVAPAEVLALLPDREALTAAVTECIDQLRTLVPELPAEIDRDTGLRGLVAGLFDGMRDGTPLARPDSAAIAGSIEACLTSLQTLLPAREEVMTMFDSVVGQADLPPELTALVEQLRQLFGQMQGSDALATFDPAAALDALRSLIPGLDGSADSPTLGILDALLGRMAPAG